MRRPGDRARGPRRSRKTQRENPSGPNRRPRHGQPRQKVQECVAGKSRNAPKRLQQQQAGGRVLELDPLLEEDFRVERLGVGLAQIRQRPAHGGPRVAARSPPQIVQTEVQCGRSLRRHVGRCGVDPPRQHQVERDGVDQEKRGQSSMNKRSGNQCATHRRLSVSLSAADCPGESRLRREARWGAPPGRAVPTAPRRRRFA